MNRDVLEERIERVLGSLPEPTRSNLEKHVNAEPISSAEIAARIRDYEVALDEQVTNTDTLDQWTANIVERKCLALLEKFDEVDRSGRRLIQAAALYFLDEDDGEDDINSSVGFDDDLEVVEAVARELGFLDIVNMHGA